MLEINVNVKIEGLKDLADAIFALAGSGGVKPTFEVAEKEPKKGRAPKKSAAPAPVVAEEPVEDEKAEEVVPTESEEEKVVTVSPEATKSNAATLHALSEAGASLLEAGKMSDLIALLHSFQVEAVTMLKPEQYDAFASGLRKLGAKI